jgi:DNA-binding transcriptional MerR regulator
MISKNEVLKRTGISYGQFYRWKRKGLIPETWFNRRSTFTGQETFLPQEKILERIRRINDLKDGHSLDEIAEMLSPDLIGRTYSVSEVDAMEWLSTRARKLYQGLREGQGPYGVNEVLFIAAIERLMRDGKLTSEQIELAARTMIAVFEAVPDDGEGRYLTVAKRSSVTFPVVSSGETHFGPDAAVVVSLDLNELLAQIKAKLREVP